MTESAIVTQRRHHVHYGLSYPSTHLHRQSYVVLSCKIDVAIVELRNEMNHRFDMIDRRFDRMGQRIDGLDEGLRGVEVQVATLAGPAPPVPVGTSDR